MDDLVVLRLDLTSFDEPNYMMTWGRVCSHDELLTICWKWHKTFTELEMCNIEVCAFLAEAAQAVGFYEALFSFARKGVPSPRRYPRWRAAAYKRMLRGQDLYMLYPASRFRYGIR